MFDKLKVKILGLIDNMSHFDGDDGKKYNIFGEGGVERIAKEYNKNFLGKIPIDLDVGKAADNGKPLVEENLEHKISKVYSEIAKKIKSSFH
jgi:ATP-binding protein involved in chromosome partitioning